MTHKIPHSTQGPVSVQTYVRAKTGTRISIAELLYADTCRCLCLYNHLPLFSTVFAWCEKAQYGKMLTNALLDKVVQRNLIEGKLM